MDIPKLTKEDLNQLTKFIKSIDLWEEVGDDFKGCCFDENAEAEKVINIVVYCLEREVGLHPKKQTWYKRASGEYEQIYKICNTT